MREFFAMGGYGFYVWSAYAVFFLVIAADCLAPLFARRRLLVDLRAREARRSARASRAAPASAPQSPHSASSDPSVTAP